MVGLLPRTQRHTGSRRVQTIRCSLLQPGHDAYRKRRGCGQLAQSKHEQYPPAAGVEASNRVQLHRPGRIGPERVSMFGQVQHAVLCAGLDRFRTIKTGNSQRHSVCIATGSTGRSNYHYKKLSVRNMMHYISMFSTPRRTTCGTVNPVVRDEY